MDSTQSHLGRTKPDTVVAPFPSLDQSLTPFLPAMMTRPLLASVASQLCKELFFSSAAPYLGGTALHKTPRKGAVLSGGWFADTVHGA